MAQENKTDYNGWANHSTWAVKLHWDNNQGDYEYFTSEAKEFKSNDRSIREFADFLQNTYEEIFQSVIDGNATEEAKSMVIDCGNGIDVDWYEIAEVYYNEVEQ